MLLYHIDKEKYQHVWPPEGTLNGKGRWNKVGQWIIYCSPSIALAKLEVLANDHFLPIKRVCMTIEVLGNPKILTLTPDVLPKNWMDIPYPLELADITANIIKSDHILLKVPSVQSPREYNYLINVRHPLFEDMVQLRNVVPEPFDPRLK